MSITKDFIRGHPVLAYYVLTFIISWSGILLVVGPSGIPATPDEFMTRLPLVLLAMLSGPTISSLLLTGLIDGRAGLRGLLSRFLKWRVGFRWYAVALLLAPALFTVIPLAVSLFFPTFLPAIFATQDKGPLVVIGIAGGLSTLLEEIGWTGFVTPRLRRRHSILSIGLIMGFLWGAWHLLVNFWSSGTATRDLSLSQLFTSLFFSAGILSAYRVLLVWVYDHTESVLVGWLMHVVLTASNIILAPLATPDATGPIWSLVMAATLWIVVALVASASRGRLSRPVRQPQFA